VYSKYSDINDRRNKNKQTNYVTQRSLKFQKLLIFQNFFKVFGQLLGMNDKDNVRNRSEVVYLFIPIRFSVKTTEISLLQCRQKPKMSKINKIVSFCIFLDFLTISWNVDMI
jgi:hypothetical protein